MDDLAERLLYRHRAASCYGCHVPYSLAVLLAVDEIDPILSPRMRDRIRGVFADLTCSLEQTQGAAGWWDRGWDAATPHRGPRSSGKRPSG